MEKTPEELFKERTKRIQDAIQLIVPDRVPFAPHIHFFVAKYAGISFQEAMYDYDKLALAVKKMMLDLQPDVFPDSAFRSSAMGPVLETLDYKQLKWPGHGLPPDAEYQFVEAEYMKTEEYDAFILDPSGFLLRSFLPRIYGAFESFTMLPSIPASYYTRMVSSIAVLGTHEVAGALETLSKAGVEARKVAAKHAALCQEMATLGFPRQFGSGVWAPFDYIGDLLRGTRGIMLDMYRNPDKLLEAIEKVTRILIKDATSVAKIGDVHRVMIPLHKGLDGFMSQPQFKTFFWPSLKRLMLALIDAGLIPNPLWEGDCTSRLEIIADMPKGKCVYWFERTDISKAKEILGDHICIEAGVPSSLLCTGTVEDVKAYCKKLIDVAGKGGGFIFNGDMGIPNEARIENVKAMAEFVKEYGVYR